MLARKFIQKFRFPLQTRSMGNVTNRTHSNSRNIAVGIGISAAIIGTMAGSVYSFNQYFNY